MLRHCGRAVAIGQLLGRPCLPSAPPLPPPWGLPVTDPWETGHAHAPWRLRHPQPSRRGSPGLLATPTPAFSSPFPPPPPWRTAALAPSPGLLSHRNGAGCESVSRKGHLQPLASDVPAAWPHSQKPQLVPPTSLGCSWSFGVPVRGGRDSREYAGRVQAR